MYNIDFLLIGIILTWILIISHIHKLLPLSFLNQINNLLYFISLIIKYKHHQIIYNTSKEYQYNIYTLIFFLKMYL